MGILDNLEAYIEHIENKTNIDQYEDSDLELQIQNPQRDQDKLDESSSQIKQDRS
jgi:hypothetical protein